MDISVTLTRMSLLFLSLLFTLSCHSQADLIGDPCKKTLYPYLCISTLRSNPSSLATDVKGLARIMFYATAVKATATLNQVNVLLKKTNDAVLIGALENCALEYASALDDIFKAIKNVGSDIFAVKGVAADLVTEAQDCEDTFTDGPDKRKSPLTVENDVLGDLAGLVIEIVDSLG
ncbi:cell wall / vacuolar inhibitor of fructosidase 1-like [Rhododendron vialii]|uniref:cell wall / vacuolar inhibitor of fructosidase 1-like n=1 Tax=Rhododendron vialii TaxID=182163 RepID=UPI00265E19DE|nr:cell wall / vacuolar inhibitor of fructosidase 1-like [Rhododendron vialii]